MSYVLQFSAYLDSLPMGIQFLIGSTPCLFGFACMLFDTCPVRRK